MTTPEPREWTVEGHFFRFESPDVLWMHIHGGCSLENAREFVALYRQAASAGPVFLLADMEGAKGMDAEARRHFSEQSEGHWFQAIIFYKTRLLIRAIAKGLVLAAQLFRAEDAPRSAPMYFVATREEALALLGQLRARDVGRCA